MIYLYVKTHRITGLKYFGKTTKDPYRYSGSGKRWKAHIRKHGCFLDTVVVGCFEDADVAREAAIKFSRDNDIVADPAWANLIEENAHDGAPVGHPGHVFTKEQLARLSAASKKMWQDPATRDRLARSQSASWTDDRKEAHRAWLAEHWTDERRARQRAAIRGRKNPSIGRPGVKKTAEHAAAISSALKGVPKIKCCRIHDRKEMAVAEFTKWLNRVRSSGTSG